jgi:acyl-CoA thioesterase FadM
VYNTRYLDPGVETPETMFVTRKMTVEYVRPTPMDMELMLQGRVVTEGKKSMQVEVELWAGGEMTAKADVLAVRAS